jgi:hypothetical protein
MGTEQPSCYQPGGDKRRADDEEDKNFSKFSEHEIQNQPSHVKNSVNHRNQYK